MNKIEIQTIVLIENTKTINQKKKKQKQKRNNEMFRRYKDENEHI